MSRRSKTSTSPMLKENASHAQEHYPVYRAFLMRSLDRCDTELAALVELNRSLHTVKSSIVEMCGEATLLDMGEGLLKLAQDGSDNLEGNIPEEGEDLCIDFLLRMKLRRKLLNRLSRRLGRLAHAMDGEDIQPPPPPKYGDLRLHIDPNAVKLFEERWKRQDHAMKLIAMRHESYIPTPKVEEEEDDVMEESENKVDAANSDKAQDKPTEQGDKSEEKTMEEQDTGDKADEAQRSDKVMEEQEKNTVFVAGKTEDTTGPEQFEENAEALKSSDAKQVEEGETPAEKLEAERSSDHPDGKTQSSERATSEAKTTEDVEMSEAKPEAEEPKSSENPAEETKSASVEPPAEETKSASVEPPAEETKSASVEQPAEETKSASVEQPAEELTSGAPTATTADNAGPEELTEDDYLDTLRDYDEAYTKEILTSTGTVNYPILKRDAEADHNFIKYGAGIGATHRTMSSKDKEMEFKRWQSAVLQRIPDQPSFEELGLANRVFFLKERRKRLAEEDVASSSKKKHSKKEETEKVSDSDSEKDSDEDVEMAEADDDDYEGGKGDDDDDDDEEEDTEMDDNEEDSESKSEDGGKAESASAKPVKPISLVAVPSFYEQDERRLRLIHAELMVTSMHDHARLKVGEATTEYNRAYRRSNELYHHRVRLQTDLNQISYETRTKLAQLKNEYLQDVAIHRQRWEQRHREHALASLPSAHGLTAMGTSLTEKAASHADPRVSAAGKALADIVDCIVTRSEAGWKDEDPIEDFKPLPMPDFSETVLDSGETLGERQERLEGGLRKQLADIATNLHLHEEERKKAWKKLLKTKSEFDYPHTHPTNTGGRRGRVSFGPNQLHLLPVPPLQGSGAAMMPATYNYPMASVPSYVPPAAAAMPMPSSRPSTSESKYSAAKVRERHCDDGSVVPASEPKRGKDGLYIRPPGRGRLGMDWDEVRGLWVPLRKES